MGERLRGRALTCLVKPPPSAAVATRLPLPPAKAKFRQQLPARGVGVCWGFFLWCLREGGRAGRGAAWGFVRGLRGSNLGSVRGSVRGSGQGVVWDSVRGAISCSISDRHRASAAATSGAGIVPRRNAVGASADEPFAGLAGAGPAGAGLAGAGLAGAALARAGAGLASAGADAAGTNEGAVALNGVPSACPRVAASPLFMGTRRS